jgi:carboxyl-terminal processing protease
VSSLRRTIAAAVAMLSAYIAGVVTGVVGSDEPPRHDSRVLDEAADRIAAQAARPVSRAELERAAVEGMLRALGDRWSSYYRPAEFAGFQAVLDGRYTGVGLWVRRDPDGRVWVASVQPGSPAAGAGVRVRDEVVSVAGRPSGGRSVADVVSALRGSAGTTVAVALRREGVVHTVRLQRRTVRSDDVTVDALAPGVVGIRVAAFTRGVGRRVRDVVAKQRAQHGSGVVLDLRDNPGGLLDEAVETASAFLAGGPVVSYERRGAAPRRLDALGSGDTTTPTVVLVDGGTASAAEVVAGALQDRRRAVVVGGRTFGKGSVQEPAWLSDGSALELTVGRYRTPTGRLLDSVGVEPDVEVAPNSAPQVGERRAVEVLAGLLVDTGTSGRG